ncbi:MAG: MipA/OmpV family protein [Candidatus Saccharimonadales bacterium]
MCFSYASRSQRGFPFSLMLLFVMLCMMSGVRAAGDDAPQDQLAQAATQSGSSWIFGGGLAVADRGYVGYSREVTPIPLVFYHNGRFFFAGFSAGYMVSHNRHYRFSLILKPRINRLSASDSPQLAGIHTRRWSLDGGANLDVFGDWGHIVTGVSHDLLNRNNGTEATVGYRYPLRLGNWTLTPELGVRWESASLVNYYYGVSPAEAVPDRPVYAPDTATSPYVGIGVSTRVTQHWRFFGRIQYTRFAGAIHDSPLVNRSGSPVIFIGLVYNAAQR